MKFEVNRSFQVKIKQRECYVRTMLFRIGTKPFRCELNMGINLDSQLSIHYTLQISL